MIKLYRAAAAAYWAVWRAGGLDYRAMCAGRDIVKKLKPDLSDEEAMRLVDRAATYAAAYYPKWFWKR